MALKITDLAYVHSGGASNFSPDSDLGGVISSSTYKLIKSQSTTTPVNVSGVTIVNGFGNPEGVGTLNFVSSTKFLGWKQYGGTVSNGQVISGSGTYIIGSSAGYLVVSVVFGSLPGTDASDSLTVANNQQNLFPHVSAQQSLVGRTDYRCLYLMNTNSVDTAVDVRVWRPVDGAGGDYVEIGLDPAGKGNGSTTGVATTIASGTDAPAGVTFSAPTTYGAALTIGNLLPLQVIALWVKRVVPSETRGTIISNTSVLALSATV